MNFRFTVCKQAGRLANEAKQLQSSAWSEKGAEVDRNVKLQANLAYVLCITSLCSRPSKEQYLRRARADARYQFIIDLLDIWIPATNLGLVNMNDGVVGIFGCVIYLVNVVHLPIVT